MNENEIQSWIEKAKHDIGTAELTFQHKPEYYDTIKKKLIEKLLRGLRGEQIFN